MGKIQVCNASEAVRISDLFYYPPEVRRGKCGLDLFLLQYFVKV